METYLQNLIQQYKDSDNIEIHKKIQEWKDFDNMLTTQQEIHKIKMESLDRELETIRENRPQRKGAYDKDTQAKILAYAHKLITNAPPNNS